MNKVEVEVEAEDGMAGLRRKKRPESGVETPIVDPLDIQRVKMEDTSKEPSTALAEIKEITSVTNWSDLNDLPNP